MSTTPTKYNRRTLQELENLNSNVQSGNQDFREAIASKNKSDRDASEEMQKAAKALTEQIEKQAELDREVAIGITEQIEKKAGLDREVAMGITEQIEKQAELDREERAEQHAESMFQMHEVAMGISGLDNTFRESSEMITEQIKESGIDIVRSIGETNRTLRSIDKNLRNIDNSLHEIGGVLTTILGKIEKPNEVQAIELADQARTSIAISDADDALRITRKAIELCATSITTNAYHLMTLSLFVDDKALKQESRIIFNKFVKLIGFKLTDSGSDTESVRDEIYHTVYATLFALSCSLRGRIFDDTQNLYAHIGKDTTLAKRFFIKPLIDNNALRGTLFPSEIRELTWNEILKQITKNEQFSYLVPYIIKVADNPIQIKNELVALANKELRSSNFLHKILNKTWQEDSATEDELSCLNIFTGFQPQDNIDLNDKVLLLLDRYVDKYDLPVNPQLKEVVMSAKLRRQQDCKRYLEMWDKCKIEIVKQEKIALSKLKETANRMQKERTEFERRFLLYDVKQKSGKIEKAIILHKEIHASLPDPWNHDDRKRRIIIIGIGFAIGFMVVAYGFLEWL